MQIHPLHLLPLLLLLTAVTSCRTISHVETRHELQVDTLHVTVRDTLRHVTTSDTLIYTTREVIQEHIITHFDPVTGHPVQQDIDRQIRRQADSLVIHLLDSIMQSHAVDTTAYHKDDIQDDLTHETEVQQPSLFRRIAETLSTIFVTLLVVLSVYLALRLYRSKQ